MFSVSRFDPRKEDARKSTGAIEKRKKKSKLRKSTDNNSDVKKKKKKRKRDSKITGGEKDENRHANTEESSSIRIATEASATEMEAKAKSAEKEIEPEQESASNAKGVDHTLTETEIEVETETEPVMEAAFRVIAPETDGALSSKKNLSAKITAEAFDDLDLTDDAWHASSSSSKKENRLSEETKDGDKNTESQPPCDPTDEIERALEMTRLPIVEAAKRWGMADFLVRNLRSNGHEHFFPIQALVIPDVIVAERHMTSLRVRDVCCAAPTGSGKTLAFVLPVLNALASRRVRRLRALVILPSRDLAQQVYRVFDDYRKGSDNDLRIGLAIGQTDFKAEQKKLILGDDEDGSGKSACESRKRTQLRYSMDPGNLDLALDAMGKELEEYNDYDASGRTRERKKHVNEIPAGGISAVDVLVCTPGRLVDHLDNTPGFTLQHLRWLIIDEADRLLSQSYHGWIQRVLDCVHEPPRPPKYDSDDDGIIPIDPVTHRRSEQDAFIATMSSSTINEDGLSSVGIGASTDICQRIQLRKLLYSATLTKDPQKLSSLRLVNPKYFNAHDLKRRQNAMSANKGNDPSGDHDINNTNLYRMPEQLKECTVECTAEQKPLVLLALLLERLNEYREVEESSASSETTKKSTIVVFASSLEATHRLTRLLQLLWQAADYNGPPPVEFSSALNQHQRSLLMKRCNDPKDRSVSVLVCSDGMSRGMDLASCRAVIHYDVPGMAKTYVHRCGRTARAGLDGTAIALLKGKGQAGQFTRLRRLIALPERVTKASVKTSLVREAIPLYKHCVSRLREVLSAEDRNELKATDPNLTRFLPSNDGNDEDSSDSDSSGDSLMSLE